MIGIRTPAFGLNTTAGSLAAAFGFPVCLNRIRYQSRPPAFIAPLLHAAWSLFSGSFSRCPWEKTSRRSAPRELTFPRQSARRHRVRSAGRERPGEMRSSPWSLLAFLGEEWTMADAPECVVNSRVQCGRGPRARAERQMMSNQRLATQSRRVQAGMLPAPYLPHFCVTRQPAACAIQSLRSSAALWCVLVNPVVGRSKLGRAVSAGRAVLYPAARRHTGGQRIEFR